MKAQPGIVADEPERLVVVGGDLDGTHLRRWTWQKRALGVWVLTAPPLGLLVAWYLHPMFALFALSSLSIPLRPELSKGFTWGRPGSSMAWYRLCADADGVVVDHLFGLGCPPPARVLDPSPSVDRLGLQLEGPFQLAWSELGPATVEDQALCIGSQRLVLTGVDAEELERVAERLEALRIS